MLDDKLQEQESRLRDLESTGGFDGRLLWRFAVDAVGFRGQIRSPSFYTGRPGYKVFLVLDVGGHDGGDDNDSDDCASIFVGVEAGRFDNQLRFPLDGAFCVTLVRQSVFDLDCVDRKRTVMFRGLRPRYQRDQSAADVGGAVGGSAGGSVEGGGGVATVGNVATHCRRLKLAKVSEFVSGAYVEDGFAVIKAEVSHVIHAAAAAGSGSYVRDQSSPPIESCVF